MDDVSEARLGEVYPTLAAKVRQLHDALNQEGIEIRVVQALRSWSQQDNLYAQGRTAPGKIVTNCKGGHSYHNFGLAVDCVPSTHGPDQPFDPDWNASHPYWKRMSDVGQSLGLVSGATWRTFPDAPHFQINGRFPEGAPDDEVRQIFRDGGMQGVWESLEDGSGVG
jgi:peptidoglycan LD-endopeptidase CwlK